MFTQEGPKAHPWGNAFALILSARLFLHVLQFKVGAPPSHTPLFQKISLPSLSIEDAHRHRIKRITDVEQSQCIL